MFGYVKACPPQLRLCEWEAYRGVYCGLCRAQGSCTGQCSRLTLRYDFAFMALVRTASAIPGARRAAARCSSLMAASSSGLALTLETPKFTISSPR